MLYSLIIYMSFGRVCLNGVIWMLKKRQYIEEEDSDDTNFYSQSVRESLLEDDELSPIEEAFMEGYDTV